jgi:hypothetical protein
MQFVCLYIRGVKKNEINTNYCGASWVGIKIQFERSNGFFSLKCSFSFIIEDDFSDQDII